MEVQDALAAICSEPWCDKCERVVVEYCCDDSTNFAFNAKKVECRGGFVILCGPDHDCIKIKVFQEGKLIAVLKAERVVIPLDKVAAILFDGEFEDHRDGRHDRDDDPDRSPRKKDD